MKKSTWDTVPVVEVRLPTCPTCGELKYIGIKGWRDADGGRTSRRVCKRCGQLYIVLSLPDCGSDDLGVW
ncbi:hypothetical protein Pla175_05510 [Pirellulimonas nuda]|uniref:Uncharacterized protein n=1 Tax=Pirellulimonas nuda TaxID=2528009 RepID=A0A518D6T4_9BACT|nr:hypothetical protein Pla175_05510 [Pirellulimonas nuda]